MRPAVPRISVLFGALVLAACGTTVSPSVSPQASSTPEPARGPVDLLAVVCAPAPRAFDPSDIDLTGAWAGDDVGVYYLQQIGSVVWWSGMSEREGSPTDLGRGWNNVGRGEINGLEVNVEWADVPRGYDTGNGTLQLRIQDDGTGMLEIVTVAQDGNFGNHVWTPCLPVELRVAQYVRTYGGDKWEYADILVEDACGDLAELKRTVTAMLDSEEAGSPEWRSALGYSNAIGTRELALDCGTTASPSASMEASPGPDPASQPPEVPAAVCAYAPRPFDPSDIDLTGAWAGDDDGIYYFRQLGSVLWWNGMSERHGSPMDVGREWNNVGRGVISGLQVDVEWADVPRGQIFNHGTLVLTIQDDGTGDTQIVTEGDPGNFGNRVWTPCLPVEVQLADYLESYGGDPAQYEVILTRRACEDLADLKATVARTLNTAEAGSPEFRAALGYSNAISERLLARGC
jgi:hypothetical protein